MICRNNDAESYCLVSVSTRIVLVIPYALVKPVNSMFFEYMTEHCRHGLRSICCASLKADLDCAIDQSNAPLGNYSRGIPKSRGCVTAAAQQEAEPPNQKGYCLLLTFLGVGGALLPSCCLETAAAGISFLALYGRPATYVHGQFGL